MKTAAAALTLMRKGNRIRSVGRTNLNEHSSRSHVILTMEIESSITTGALEIGNGAEYSKPKGRGKQRGKIRGGSGQPVAVRVGTLHMVDLAGSERLSLSG